MTREQAIEVLISRYNSGVIRSRTNDDEWRLATDTAIAALRGWVRTEDRLPENGDDWVVGLFLLDDGRTIPDTVPSGTVKRQIKMCPYWIPLPKLPEVDDD